MDVTVNLVGLVPRLGKRTRFTIQVKPTKGPVLVIKRTTPPELTPIMELVEQASAGEPTLAIRGEVIGDADPTKAWLDTVKFTLTNAAQAAEAVDLSSTGLVVTYLDGDQALNCTNGSGSGPSHCFWTTSWIIGSGDLVDPGEQVDLTVDISNLTPVLRNKKEFTIQVKPNNGVAVIVNWATPAEYKPIQALRKPN